jgi:hypothetical protein
VGTGGDDAEAEGEDMEGYGRKPYRREQRGVKMAEECGLQLENTYVLDLEDGQSTLP